MFPSTTPAMRRAVLRGMSCLLLATPLVAQDITVGSVTARVGEKASGYWRMLSLSCRPRSTLAVTPRMAHRSVAWLVVSSRVCSAWKIVTPEPTRVANWR